MTLEKLFFGTVIHSVSLESFHILTNCLIGLQDGKIHLFEHNVDQVRLEAVKQQYNVGQVVVLKGWQFFMPGFIDTHVHAPQYSYTGTASDFQLLEWLTTYTFPEESKLENVEYAEHVYTRCVRRLLRNGTTCAAYFATLHVEASKVLMQIMQKLGQRGWVGKVCMDTNSPEYYCETGEQAVQGTRELLLHAKGNELVEACITPRFAPSCTKETLQQLGDLAREFDAPVQSHISENRNEVAWVKELFPESSSYTAVYNDAGLLTNRTVMAHGIHLTDEEHEAFKHRGASISHCPTSNFALRSGVLNVRQLIQKGIKVSLGTDVAGGYATSILSSVRDASTASKLKQLENETDGSSDVPFLKLEELFYLATLGGAECMGLQERVGSFVIGKEWDALLVDVEESIDIFHGNDDWRSVLEKFLFLGDDRCITKVWVAGRIVKE